MEEIETLICPMCNGTGHGHYEGLFSSKKEVSCPSCDGTGSISVTLVYENICDNVLYFKGYNHLDLKGYNHLDLKTQLAHYIKKHPNIKIVNISASFHNGVYGAYIDGYIVITEPKELK